MHSTFCTTQTYGVKTVSRDYRSSFSQAYKVLYKEGELSYLTEILDSAQEGTLDSTQAFPISGSIVRSIPFLRKFLIMAKSLWKSFLSFSTA
jgi:hypothetical protein